jgi:hypothetical protein
LIIANFLAIFLWSPCRSHQWAAFLDCVQYDIFFGIGSLAIGWILGLALIRQAKGHQAMTEQRREEYERVKKQNLNTLTDATRDERS